MPVEAPNTLRSRARYKIIDILGQGPMIGLVNGAKSVYLNDTQVQANNDTLNFSNFSIANDLQQLPIPDIAGQTIKYNPALFPLSENEVSVGVKVTKDSPEGSLSGDGSVTRTITDTNVDSVRITMRVPALTTTNTTTGDITGGSIGFNIYVKPDGGSFQPAFAGCTYIDLASPGDETPSSAQGLLVTATIPPSSSALGLNVSFQYRKKTGGSWGSWIEFASLRVPAYGSSFDNVSFQSDWWNKQKTFMQEVRGLPLGVYQAQVVASPAGSALTRTQYLAGGQITIQGKTVSPYDADYIVQLPGDGPWDIKVERATDDPPTANIQADLYWLSYTEQISNRFSWPNTAGVAITFDAEDFGGQIPTRAYDVMGLVIKVPANYDAYNRTYSGVWNGTFKDSWTDNPAWIFYDLLTNKRYGLGDNIDAAQIDKYALYQIAQYCDELVDAPNGELEPRYTCSCVINSQSEAYELLTAIASAFRGMIYLSGGTITPTADMPTDSSMLVGPANVIDGIFTYQGASRKARHTVARVSWNNPDDGYKLNVELYEDDEAIRKYGYRPIDINAFGCTSRGLARRWGKWAITSDNDAPDTVTYKAGFDHFARRPGDVVSIADPNYSGEQLFGLIADVTDNVSPATHTITLDRVVTRVAGDTSELQLTLADGTILALDVAVTGSDVTSAEITVDSEDLTTIPLVGASWLLKKGTVEPRQWRIISISEDEPHVYQVTAMLYDPNKFDKVETDLNFAEADFTAFPEGPMPAPTGVAQSEFLKQTGSAILACVNLSWTRPNDPRADLFEVQYQLDGEEWRTTEPNLTQFTGVDILNIVPGVYNFRVRAQDTSGLFRSAWTTLASQTLLGKDKAPEDVTGFTAVIEKYGVLLNWSPVSDIDLKYYEIRRGTSWAAGTFVGRTAGTVFKWEDATEAAYTFWIKAIDTNLNESENATDAAATVEVEATPTVVGATVKGGIAVTISGVTTSRFAHYELQRKESTEVDGDAVTVNALLASRTFTDTLVADLGYVPLYQYRARAINKNLNPSAYSEWSEGVNPGQIEGTDIVDAALNRSELFQAGVVDAAAISAAALKQAGGSIGAWSAQNCTTASIAEAGGVIDVSGKNKHGQAFGGVAVVDTDLGAAFEFDGSDDYIDILEPITSGLTAISVELRLSNVGNIGLKIAISAGDSPYVGVSSGHVYVSWHNASSEQQTYIGAAINDVDLHHIIFTHDGDAWALYLNGVLASGGAGTFMPVGATGITIGRYRNGGYNFPGKVFTPRIYNRALTASEVKSRYMFPGDVAFARITADFMGVDSVVARSLAAEAVTTPKLAAGAVTMEKLLVASPGSALNDDPNFQDASSWAVHAGRAVNIVTVTDGIVGNKALRGYSDGSANHYRGSKLTPIDKTKTYRVTALFRKSGSPTGSSYLGLYEHGQDGAYLGTLLYYSPYGVTNSELTTEFARHAATITPAMFNASTRFVYVSVIVGSSTTGGYVEAQDARIEECLPATLIQDGAIVTEKLAVGAVKAGKIYAGAVETAALAAGAVTANKVGANAITAEKIDVTAIKAPADPVAKWAAKGSTTTTIALSGGVKDISGKGNNGTAYGGVAVVETDLGAAFSFDGSNDYIDTETVLTSAAAFSLSAFVKTTAAGFQMIATTQKSHYAYLAMNGGALQGVVEFAGGGNASAVTTDLVNDGEWHLITFVYNGSTVKIYIDGAEKASANGSGSILTISAYSLVGAYNSGGGEEYFFAGQITNLCIFSRALSVAEIKTLYMLGTDSESGTITADRVVTGQIKSLNYSTTAGSMIDLDDGTFKFGGSSAPKLSWNGTTLAVSGNLTGSTGEIGGLDILDAGIGSDGSELISSKYSAIIMFAEANDGVGNISDTGSSCFLSLSYTSGPTLNSSVRIAATGYYDGSTAGKAHIKIVAESSSDYAIDTNGKIQGDTIDISDERLKSGIQAVSTLDKLKTLSVTEWHYDDEKIRQKIREEEVATTLREGRGLKVRKVYSPDIDYKPIERHIGPMAADFNRLFGVSNGSETGINLSDGIGVALRAIQELAEIVDEQAATIAELRAALKLPERQKKQAAVEFTAEEIEMAADSHVKVAYENIMQEVKGRQK